MRNLIPVLLAVLGFGLGFVVFHGAAGQAGAGPEAAVGSGFTYQGRLEIDGTPADGSYDFQFKLFDATTGGNQVGSTVNMEDVIVTDGLFTVLLDFGGSAFDGQGRWLQLAVREADSTGSYSQLSPRQQLTAAPYALHAAEAGSVAWGDVQNRPPGLDDGDDDTTYTAGTGLVLAGTQFSAEGSPYGNVLVVAQSGGDFSSVQAALDSIGDASPDNPYLVYVAPGVYTETVTLKPYVTLEGAGEGTTTIHGSGGSQAPADGSGSATLVGADNATIRHLTVESDGTGQDYAVAIQNNSTSPIITYVTATGLNAYRNYGVFNESSSPEMSNVTATASGVAFSYGVYNSSSSPAMTNVTASASSVTYSSGVYNDSSSPVMTNVTATASSGAYIYGVANYNSSLPVMTNVTASASSGVYIYGVYSDDSSSPTIQRSMLEGSTYSVRVGGTGKVANSQLIGPPSSGLTCFNNYDENLAAVTCP